MSKSKDIMRPNILVLEGCFGDAAQIIEDAGGCGIEAHPWDYNEVEDAFCNVDQPIDGLLLTGGSDIDPRLYNEKPDRQTCGVDYVRDTVEYAAMKRAMELRIPVLGICRGSQIMCAFRGGKLTQHIDGHRGNDHRIVAAPNARTLRRAMGSRAMDVTSLHHQCVRRPGKGMRVAAYALDGTPEAIESKDGLWLGVQFHPELDAYNNSNAYQILRWLVQASAQNAGGRAEIVRFRQAREIKNARVEMYYAKKKAQAKNRKAGTRNYAGSFTSPSYDELAWGGELQPPSIEELDAAESCSLHLCNMCGMLFDHKEDRDDHEAFLHWGDKDDREDVMPGASPQTEREAENVLRVKHSLESRYPELCPPVGHPAWDDDESIDGTCVLVDDEDGISWKETS